VTATCSGKDGWKCDFDATGYEPEESTCGDGKDNDCDGQVDEGCSCPLGKSQMFVVQWGNSPALIRADLDGQNAAPVAALSGSALGQIAVDAKNNKLYYSDASNHILRCGLGRHKLGQSTRPELCCSVSATPRTSVSSIHRTPP
jgi:hypothetical protein